MSESSPAVSMTPCAAVVFTLEWDYSVHSAALSLLAGVGVVSVLSVRVCKGIHVHVNTFVSVVSASSLSFCWELSTINYAATHLALCCSLFPFSPHFPSFDSPYFLLLISLFSSLSLSVSIFLPFFIYNLPHTPSFSNSISVSCFGRTCWASAKAIMRTVKQRQMNRWERRREKEREMKRQRERERHEYEVLALLWLLTVHSRMHGHKNTPIPLS